MRSPGGDVMKYLFVADARARNIEPSLSGVSAERPAPQPCENRQVARRQRGNDEIITSGTALSGRGHYAMPRSVRPSVCPVPIAQERCILGLLLLSPHIMRRHIICCMFFWSFLWVTPARKSTKFGSRYLGEGSSERDEILQVARGGLMYPTTPTRPVIFGPGGSPGEPKKFCNDFLQGGFTDVDEIWHDRGL